jgi:hypothetical protein
MHTAIRAIAPIWTGDINDLRIPILLMSSLHSEGLFFLVFTSSRHLTPDIARRRDRGRGGDVRYASWLAIF